uniref:Protein rolling stone n=1 Tax=Xenopsylla cheopis TaxID=163159 RepID=A0A6M2DY25_XENCH
MLGLFFFCLVIASWALQEKSPEFWLIYLTHWGIALCCVQTLFAAGLVTFRHYQIQKLESVPYHDKMPIAYKMYWGAQTCTVTVAFGISIIYWTLLHSAEYSTVMNFMTHGMNSILMLVDLFVISHPTKLLHFYLAICVSLIYAIFSVIYFWADGLDPHDNHFIYNILDWNNPGPAVIVVVGGLVLLIFLHILVFLIYKFRLYLHARLNRNNTMVLPISTISGRTNLAYTYDCEGDKSETKESFDQKY